MFVRICVVAASKNTTPESKSTFSTCFLFSQQGKNAHPFSNTMCTAPFARSSSIDAFWQNSITRLHKKQRGMIPIFIMNVHTVASTIIDVHRNAQAGYAGSRPVFFLVFAEIKEDIRTANNQTGRRVLERVSQVN